jgi:hypothetical protein
MANPSFQLDPDIAEVAVAYSLDALEYAANLGVTLDWSDSSVEEVEMLLAQLHSEMANSQPPNDAVWKMAKVLGSYVGEVLRRHHGGEWGMVQWEDQSFPGLQISSGSLCWPWGKVRNRLVNGPEDNVWHYFKMLTQ